MTAPGDGFVLAVDLGTSHTVAMMRWPDERTRPLLFDGQPLLPSAVYLDAQSNLHVGRDAQRLGYADPARIEPHPKRHIDAESILLGGADVPVAALFAALLGAVAREAVNTVGFLPPAVLTYPAAWGRRRRAVLTDALARAGWPAGTGMIPEPVAAARYFADVLRRPVPVGSSLAVFDFGGGTLDIAVVRNEGLGPGGRPRFEVAASGGADDLGGLDLDAGLVDHLGKALAGGEPAAWGALGDPRTLAQWRARRQFWEDVRGAKEMLSRSALAPVPVPGVEQAVHLTRDELEASAGTLIRRGVSEAGAVIKAAGLTPSELAGLFLVGGSSRVPMVARLLHSELGIAPTVLEQPELPVAEGAIVAVVQASAGAAMSPATSAAPAGLAAVPAAAPAATEPRFRQGVAEAATPTPTPATVPHQPTGYEPPPTPAPAAMRNQPTGYEPLPTPAPAAVPGRPARHEPAPAGRPAGYEPPPAGQAAGDYAAPVDPWATGEAAAFGPGGPPPYNGGGGTGHTMAQPAQEPWLASTQAEPAPAAVPAPSKGGVPAYRRKWVLIVAAGLAVVLVAGGLAAWYFWPGYRPLDFQALVKSPAVSLAPAVPLTGFGFADAAVIGDRAYFANEAEDKTLGVIAADTSSGKRVWPSTKAGRSASGWDKIIAVPDALVAFDKPNIDTGKRKMVVLDADDGDVRWQREMPRDDGVYIFPGVAVQVDEAGSRLVGLRMSDGTEKWKLPDVKADTSTTLIVASTPADVGGPALVSGTLLSPESDDTRMLQVMADRSARVIDWDSGDVLVQPKQGVADPNTPVMVHNGRVVVAEKQDNAQRILSYDLKDLSGPQVIGSIDADADVKALAPCGDDHACWIESKSYDGKANQVGGANVSKGASPIWHTAAPGADNVVPVGENVLVSRESTGPAAKVTLLNSAGKEQWTADGQGARLDGGNVLVFSKALSTSVDDPSLTGQPVGDDPEPLGALSGVHPASCSWNTEVIACVAETDMRLQRFVS